MAVNRKEFTDRAKSALHERWRTGSERRDRRRRGIILLARTLLVASSADRLPSAICPADKNGLKNCGYKLCDMLFASEKQIIDGQKLQQVTVWAYLYKNK